MVGSDFKVNAIGNASKEFSSNLFSDSFAPHPVYKNKKKNKKRIFKK